MRKKNFIIIFIIIILLVIGGNYIYNTHNIQKNNQVKVDEALFTLPNGFHEVNSSIDGVKISDGSNDLIIFNYKDNNIDNYVDKYKESKLEENITVEISNFSVGNYWVYKANAVDNPYVVHYWFLFNHKIYSIYTEDGNKNTDNLVSELINNIKKA